MDALSDILKSVHLEGAVYLNAEFSAPWCVQGECGIPKVKERMAAAEHVMFFHFLTEGACKARLAGSNEIVSLVAGDLLLFPQDDRHFLGSDPQIAPMGVGGMVSAEDMASGEFVQIRHGGGGPVTRFVCGYLACNRSLSRPLFEALPRMLRIPVGDGPASSLLRELLRTAVRETLAERPGTESMLSKLSELLFVEAMRRYVDSLTARGSRMAVGRARSARGPRARADARRSLARMDGRRARARSRAVALRAGGALHHVDRRAADPVSGALAPRARCAFAARGRRRDRAHRREKRL